MPEWEAEILGLGGLGDGYADFQGRRVWIAYTAPGDRVSASLPGRDGRASMQQLVTPGPARVTPPCRHFGVCGGCSLQHISDATYQHFKAGILADILRRLGSDVSPAAFVAVGAGQRRRTSLKIRNDKGNISLCYQAAASHDLVPIEECPVTSAQMTQLLPPLRSMLTTLKKPGRIEALTLTVLTSGIDLYLTLKTPLIAADQDILRAWATEAGLARLSVEFGNDSRVLFVREATIDLDGIAVEFPPRGFLQATQSGEVAIRDVLLRHLPAQGRILDLYCGLGTYTLPLAKRGATVRAIDGTQDMIAALANAAHRHGWRQIVAEIRDLYRTPVPATECRSFDAAIINPPRNGALTQVKELATSGIPLIAMVSCNPATFERDAAHLLAHGYRIVEAVAIDQFVWSAHLEIVAIFRRIAS